MKNIFILIIAFFLIGCLGQKKVAEKTTNTKQTQVTTVTKDSSKVVEKNKEIVDELKVSLKTNNKQVDSIIRERLRGFKTSKVSGSNKYKAQFDYEELALNIHALIGETQNQTTTTSNNTDTEKTFEQRTDEYIYKKITSIPWYLWVAVAFWFAPQIISRIQMIVNPLSVFIKK